MNEHSPVNDMVDDVSQWPLMQQQLTACAEILEKPYAEADAAAIEHQRQHRAITLVAAACGTLAVLFAIVSLSNLVKGPFVLVLEVVAVLIALTAVFLGVYAALQSRWLKERHRAERCRLLKFNYLTDPVLWTGNAEAITSRTSELRDELGRLAKVSMHKWMDDDNLPDLPVLPKGADFSPNTLRQLVDYYLLKRLGVQMDFFSSRTRGNTFMDKCTRHIPPIFFFISVVAALAHFAFDIFAHAGEVTPGQISMFLIMIAASMPVLGAGVRTVRTAYEFARNTVRYRAKLVTLRRLKEKLPHETDPLVIFHELWHCEQILESEHREWLRLMIDAEWFG